MLYGETKKACTIAYEKFQEKEYMPFKHPGYSTKAIHSGQHPESVHGSVNVPIHLSSTFAQKGPACNYSDYDYTRCGNPTRDAFQKCIADCHFAKHCICFSSGCAATNAVFSLYKGGDHFIVCDDVYGGTNRLLNKIFTPRHDIKVDFVDMTDPENVRKAIQPTTKLIWIETPTNPTLKVIDIESIVKIAKEHQITTVCDTTFDSPFLLSPILLGVDIAYDSCSKYINGHSDVIMGTLCFNSDELKDQLFLNAKSLGGCPSPFDCYMAMRGHKTMALRVQEATKNAFHIAHYLAKHPLIEKVIYPGLKEHPQHDIARKQMRGFGGMVTFYIKGGLEQASKFLKAVHVITLAESLGGVESLIELPAVMTHGGVPAQHRAKLGITDNMIRLSSGVEDLEDLLQDLNGALEASKN